MLATGLHLNRHPKLNKANETLSALHPKPETPPPASSVGMFTPWTASSLLIGIEVLVPCERSDSEFGVEGLTRKPSRTNPETSF